MKIENIHLKVKNLTESIDYYENILGLSVHAKTDSEAVLGNPKDSFLYLHYDEDYTLTPQAHTGLYHFAILLGSRSDLADFVNHCIENEIPVLGASDHLYSEAIYLQDPNGHGIEIYADRDKSTWVLEDGYIKVDTLALDVADLLAQKSDTKWTGLNEAAHIGHIHLQTNDIVEAEKFYSDILGLKQMSKVPSARFLSDQGYHHDIAVNAWAGPSLTPSLENQVAMMYFTVILDDIETLLQKDITPYLLEETEEHLTLIDNAGIQIKIIKKIQE